MGFGIVDRSSEADEAAANVDERKLLVVNITWQSGSSVYFACVWPSHVRSSRV